MIFIIRIILTYQSRTCYDSCMQIYRWSRVVTCVNDIIINNHRYPDYQFYVFKFLFNVIKDNLDIHLNLKHPIAIFIKTKI